MLLLENENEIPDPSERLHPIILMIQSCQGESQFSHVPDGGYCSNFSSRIRQSVGVGLVQEEFLRRNYSKRYD